MKKDRLEDLRADITARMIAALEKGDAPFIRPWQDAFAPQNAVTGRRYNGANAFYLGLLAFDLGGDPRWCTLQQAREKGWHVRKGEKGTSVFFWKFLEKEDEEGEKKRFPFATYFTVFHASQIEGIPEYAPAAREIPPVEAAEKIILSSGANIRHGGNRAYYTPATDIITLPPRSSFLDAGYYYGVALHELAHWTGHKSRLDRPIGGVKGSPEYAREELVAEMAATFLTAETGVPQSPEHFEQHAGYISLWIELLKNDNNALFRAASEASKAANYLLRQKAEKEEAAT